MKTHTTIWKSRKMFMAASLTLLLSLISLSSCEELIMEDDIEPTPENVFDYLWTQVDKKYSFFELKRVNWDSVRQVYRPQLSSGMSDEALFDLLFAMLNELRDAHVNLTSPFNVSRYEEVFLNSPVNYDGRLIRESYLKDDYYRTDALTSQFLANGQVGYIRYPSFRSSIPSEQIEYVIRRFIGTKGLIIDVRSNGGGSPWNIFPIAARLTQQRKHIYTTFMKNGIDKKAFSLANPVYVSPRGTFYPGKVAILTNRGSYSATSFFAAAMKSFPNVIQVGDTTGGGSGSPTGGELPNGWNYRFSATITTTADGFNFENGLPPDIRVDMIEDEQRRGIDTILERAISELLK